MTARILLIITWLGGLAWAQPPKKQPDYKLELKPAPNLPSGKAAAAKGKAVATPDHFFVENIGVLQPVVVTLIAKKKGDAIKVVLGKATWEEKFREGVTGPDGQVTLKLRTQGELRIRVSANDSEPLPYLLLVWVGDEIKPELKSVTVSMKDYKAKKSGGSNAFVGIGIALAIVGVLGLVIRKKLRGAR